MSLILNIDTALETATVSLVMDGKLISAASSTDQKDHASWLHPAIHGVLQQNEINLHQLDAIAVSIGPGSYTGLRVGLSAAKGLCFALHIPLITIGTLEILAETARGEAIDLVCPLIDARRMEVFTAIYDKSMTLLEPPHALILNDRSFSHILEKHPVIFFGSGSKKLQPLINNPHAAFKPDGSVTEAFARLSQKSLEENKFADLAYSEPLYIKEFHTTARKD